MLELNPVPPTLKTARLLRRFRADCWDVRIGSNSVVGRRTSIRGRSYYYWHNAEIEDRTFHALKGTSIWIGANSTL